MLWVALIAGCLLLVLVVLACVVQGGYADRQAEIYFERWKEERHTK